MKNPIAMRSGVVLPRQGGKPFMLKGNIAQRHITDVNTT